ncbi:unnamed protein product [Brugia timori]|uniref:Bacteriocin n=1 Tax=Brugia timori TaxID=42155 RepID=A0A0R3Q496_9BILA|nr:unnamed protein product [Brugia timori]
MLGKSFKICSAEELRRKGGTSRTFIITVVCTCMRICWFFAL